MAKLRIESRMRESFPDREVNYIRSYNGNGELTETRLTQTETDYFSSGYIRTSPDNGRTWGEWVKQFEDVGGEHRDVIPGNEFGDEYLGGGGYSEGSSVLDAKSGCRVCASCSHYNMNGRKGYYEYWEEGKNTRRSHAYYAFKRPDGSVVERMFEFEEGGCDYDPANPRNPAFLDKNCAMTEGIRLLPDGTPAAVLWVQVTLCCKMAGVDVNTFFPSCPDLHKGIVLARFHWNAEKNDYDIHFSNPLMVSDLQSARCLMDHQLVYLKSGRLLMVLRGSNMMEKAWNTRTTPATPGFKWYAYSDDGGLSFTPVMPWHFDTREVVYSSAAGFSFIRSTKNGKLYFVGNVINEPWRIYGNDPRHILQICEVDDTYGHLIKDTLTVIDTLREGQTDVELNNFYLYENRETLDFEIQLTKIDFNGQLQSGGCLYSEAWEYIIHLD